MVVAGESFAMDNPTFTKDTPNLLQCFGDYLTSLGTQPVTVPVEGVVDYMIESYTAACAESPPLKAFMWARSAELLRSTLESFVSTRDCFFHHEGCMPVIEATFIQTVAQPTGELFVGLHLGWNPPTVDFDGLQNVYRENKAFCLKPKLHDDREVQFETELGGLLPWNPALHQFEGRWPPVLASMAGAQRLEAYTLLLNMTAQIKKIFPGDMQFERTIRLSIPITIKRKPDICGTRSPLSYSPAVRRPAFSCFTSSPLKFSSTHTTPQAVADQFNSPAKDDGTPPSYKELDDLLKLKAKTGTHASPLRFNPLNMAQLWEATAPRPETSNFQCYHMDENLSSKQVSSSGREQTSRSSLSKTPLVETSSNMKRSPPRSDRKEDYGPSKRRALDCSMERSDNHAESVMGTLHRIDSCLQDSLFAESMTQSSETKSSWESCGPKRQEIWSHSTPLWPSWEPSPTKVSPRGLQDWRDAPERLNEAEKDELQRTIQLSYLTFAMEKSESGGEDDSSGHDGGSESSDVDQDSFGE